MGNVEIVTLESRPSISIRRTIRQDQMGEFFQEVMPLLGRAAGSQAAGPPYARYHVWNPPEVVDVEAGIPVSQPVAAQGELKPSELPACRAARGMHRGPYETLAQSYEALHQSMEAGQLNPGEGPWEVYLTDPRISPDPATWVTEILWPVR